MNDSSQARDIDLVVLASGNGSNFEALVQALPGYRMELICNVENAFVLERARRLHIRSHSIPHACLPSRRQHEEAVLSCLQKNCQSEHLQMIVLAGYMRILSSAFLGDLRRAFPNMRLVNIHPAHLHIYKGAHAYRFACESKAPSWGLSVHEVTEDLDAGPILAAVEHPVYPWETEAELKDRFLPLEHAVLTQTIQGLLSQKVTHPDNTQDLHTEVREP